MSQLCQLSDVKNYLGITTAATDDVLTTLVANLSSAIETFCNTTFELATYTETRNGNGRPSIYLHDGPIVSVQSVTIDTYAVPAASDALAPGFVFDDKIVYLRGLCVPATFTGGLSVFNRGVQNVVISYTAGYATIPADVNQACVLWCADIFAKRNRIDKKSETLGTQQTQSYDLSPMPVQVKSMLMPYVRFTP